MLTLGYQWEFCPITCTLLAHWSQFIQETLLKLQTYFLLVNHLLDCYKKQKIFSKTLKYVCGAYLNLWLRMCCRSAINHNSGPVYIWACPWASILLLYGRSAAYVFYRLTGFLHIQICVITEKTVDTLKIQNLNK